MRKKLATLPTDATVLLCEADPSDAGSSKTAGNSGSAQTSIRTRSRTASRARGTKSFQLAIEAQAPTPTKPINSRRKGAGGELELSNVLLEHLGIKATRNLLQSRQGGHDLLGLPVALEVKRYATATDAQMKQWWDQATKQAEVAEKVPALAYRLDRNPWLFFVPLSFIRKELPFTPGFEFAARISLEAFAMLIREEIKTDF